MFTTIFKLVRGIHTGTKNVTSRETNVLTKFNEDWTKNVTSRKTAPPPGGHFHDDWAKIVTSRVFTRNNCPAPWWPCFSTDHFKSNVTYTVFTSFEHSRGIIGTNVLTKFHEDGIRNVASRVFTRQNVDDARRTTDKRRSQKLAKNALKLGFST
ncbi:hypothetical protein DPMN_101972 [Dreissena polymorpha]|uniref:Uncharacterized protein n=1 Tax=Dreissena polymorpha TaxID=45954 RepID=A0A9D4LJP2_DREPO|nr:hypothetical protein DPMN_101972 [Dreissena polymorpha]